jgi:hypothetical protein
MRSTPGSPCSSTLFAWTRRLGHRLGLASWAGDESAAPPRLDAPIADLDRLDGSEAFVRPSAMASIEAAGKREGRAALARIERVLGDVLAERRSAGRRAGDFLDEASFTAVTPYPDQIGGVARAAEACPVTYRRR